MNTKINRKLLIVLGVIAVMVAVFPLRSSAQSVGYGYIGAQINIYGSGNGYESCNTQSSTVVDMLPGSSGSWSCTVTGYAQGSQVQSITAVPTGIYADQGGLSNDRFYSNSTGTVYIGPLDDGGQVSFGTYNWSNYNCTCSPSQQSGSYCGGYAGNTSGQTTVSPGSLFTFIDENMCASNGSGEWGSGYAYAAINNLTQCPNATAVLWDNENGAPVSPADAVSFSPNATTPGQCDAVLPTGSITSISVSCSPNSIDPNGTTQCSATVSGTGSFSSAVTWSSSNTSLATVDPISGQVTGVVPGAVNIIATSAQATSTSGSTGITVSMPSGGTPPGGEGYAYIGGSIGIWGWGNGHEYCNLNQNGQAATPQAGLSGAGSGSWSCVTTPYSAYSSTTLPVGVFTDPDGLYNDLFYPSSTANITIDKIDDGGWFNFGNYAWSYLGCGCSPIQEAGSGCAGAVGPETGQAMVGPGSPISFTDENFCASNPPNSGGYNRWGWGEAYAAINNFTQCPNANLVAWDNENDIPVSPSDALAFVPDPTTPGQCDPVLPNPTGGDPIQIYSPPAPGLIGWWPLNEGSGNIAYDHSGNLNNGTWRGLLSSPGSTHYTAGIVWPYAGYFDGNDDYIALGATTTSYLEVPNVTLTMWTRLPSHQLTYWNTTGVDELSWGYTMILDGGYFDWNIMTGTRYVLSYSAQQVGKWYFLAGTYNASTSQECFYVNGSSTGVNPSACQTASMGYWEANEPFEIAGYDGYGSYPYYINDVRIYNYAMSQQQISQLYQQSIRNCGGMCY